jgi:hypothetical protein
MRNDETELVGVGNGTQIGKRLVKMKTQMIVALFRRIHESIVFSRKMLLEF